MTSLNPVLPIGFQIAETVITHQPNLLAQRKLARARATRDDIEQIMKLLKKGADEQAINKYAESKGLSGIEAKSLTYGGGTILARPRKEKIIMSLHSEKVGSFDKDCPAECRKEERICQAGCGFRV